MWPILGILLIALLIGGFIVYPWTTVEENAKTGNWKQAAWYLFCGIGFLCYWFTGLKWVGVLMAGIILIKLLMQKRKGRL